MGKKTVWFNVLSVAALIINQLQGQVIPAEYAAVGIAVINAISTIMRKKT